MKNINARTFGKSSACNAGCPDCERTGYPGAYQWYDEEKKLWRWLFVGSSTDDATSAKVEKQANTHEHLKIGTRVRFVFVKRWVRGPKKGWKAQIKFVVEAKKTGRK